MGVRAAGEEISDDGLCNSRRDFKVKSCLYNLSYVEMYQFSDFEEKKEKLKLGLSAVHCHVEPLYVCKYTQMLAIASHYNTQW